MHMSSNIFIPFRLVNNLFKGENALMQGGIQTKHYSIDFPLDVFFWFLGKDILVPLQNQEFSKQPFFHHNIF
jgi:hypothetical protein